MVGVFILEPFSLFLPYKCVMLLLLGNVICQLTIIWPLSVCGTARYPFIKVNNIRGSYDDGLQFWFKVETNTVLCWLQLPLVSEKLSH